MPTAIPRTAWQDPAKPILGPARKKPFQQGVVHYEGNWTRDQTPLDIPAYLRQMRAGYLAARGYSLGYGFGVVSDVRHPDDGTRWEIRGADINMASNPGRKWKDDNGTPTGNSNDWTGSVLLIGKAGVPASEKAAAAVRSIFAEWHAEAGTRPVRPFPHSVLDYTSCCGDAYRADLEQGRFDPAVAPPPPPPPVTIPGVPDMFHAIAPVRNSDTRAYPKAPVGPGEMSFGLNPAIPADAVAVAMNVVAISTSGPGYVTVWPGGPRPNTSVVNYQADGTAYNGALIVGVKDRAFNIYTQAKAHLIVDITGYWTA